MRPANDKLFSWLLGFGHVAKYNLSSSGLSEPVLSSMGVDTSFERFAAEKDEHAKRFTEEVAALYKVQPDSIVVTSGASEAIYLVYSVLGQGRSAVVPLPNYGAMFNVPRFLDMQVRHALSTAMHGKRTILGLTDPNNPTGARLDASTIESLMASSRANHSIIFINETYREFTFASPPRTHFGANGRVVVCNTMTKFYGLGRLRVGWVIAEREAAQRLSYGKWAVSGHDSEYSLWIATQVLRNRQKFVERAHRIYSENAKLVRKFIADTNAVSSYLGPAPFCLVHYKKGPDSVAFARALLNKTGVMVAPGDFFGAPKSFRLCFTAEESTLRTGLDELSAFLNRLAR